MATPPVRVDRDALAWIVREIYDLCSETIEGPWLPQDLVPLYRDALQSAEVAMQDGLDVLRSDDPDLDARLELAGFSPPELKLKETGFRRALGRFRVPRPKKWHLRLAFKWGNTILGSLTKAIIQFEPLKELKEGIEAGLDEMRDDEDENGDDGDDNGDD
jgi:hypothetical protein